MKRLVVYFVIVLLLCMSAAIIFMFSNYSFKLKSKYPDIACDSIYMDYDVDAETKAITGTNLLRWTEDAFKEYKVNKAYEKNEKETAYKGLMQCFCTYRKLLGDKITRVYTDASGYKKAFCNEYESDLT